MIPNYRRNVVKKLLFPRLVEEFLGWYQAVEDEACATIPSYQGVISWDVKQTEVFGIKKTALLDEALYALNYTRPETLREIWFTQYQRFSFRYPPQQFGDWNLILGATTIRRSEVKVSTDTNPAPFCF